MTDLPSSDPFAERSFDPAGAHPRADTKSRIVDALFELVAERSWDEISIADVARRADASLAEFRDAFPSKGAILAGFSRKVDKIVLEGTNDDLIGEPTKERLFDVLMRRLDAMAPYKAGVAAILAWTRRDPVSAAALNRSALNSMRFMLEAAGIGSEGASGAVKLQGLVIAWARVLDVWTRDNEPDLARTMATLDRELMRGASIIARVEDVDRLTAPLRSLARSVLSGRLGRRVRTRRSEARPRRPEDDGDEGAAAII
jgi:AcrR family transcriptional regulator